MTEILGDSGDYELLTQGIQLAEHIPGLCLEIGTRLGMSAKVILDAMRTHCPEKTLISLDPYGSILYEVRQDQVCRLDYTNQMKNECMMNLWADVYQYGGNFIPLPLEDTEFFERYADGVPLYDIEKRVENRYSFVFFDGPHGVDAIVKECEFFFPRTPIGGCWCFDDITPDFYDHNIIKNWMGDRFQTISEGSKKGLYRKVK